MLTSELIEQLQRMADKYGDVSVEIEFLDLEDSSGDPVEPREALDAKICTLGSRCVRLLG